MTRLVRNATMGQTLRPVDLCQTVLFQAISGLTMAVVKGARHGRRGGAPAPHVPSSSRDSQDLPGINGNHRCLTDIFTNISITTILIQLSSTHFVPHSKSTTIYSLLEHFLSWLSILLRTTPLRPGSAPSMTTVHWGLGYSQSTGTKGVHLRNLDRRAEQNMLSGGQTRPKRFLTLCPKLPLAR